DPGCSAAPLFASLGVPSPAAGGAVSSAAFTPTRAGTYRWIASYSGDDANTPVAGSCDDAGESTTVGRATPMIATRASPDGALGATTLTDTVEVTGRAGATAGATVDFR